jgi:hypothetical protein
VPLKMDVLYQRIEQMAAELPRVEAKQQWLQVQDYMRQVDPQSLRQKLRRRERGAKIPWLVAKPIHTLAGTFAAPSLPADLSVVAADGSSIPPDRHSAVRYYVLNIGYVVLTYGSTPQAVLDSRVEACFEPEELYFDPLGKRIPIEGARLGIHMSVEEMAGLRDATYLATSPMVALRDGSLILWNLQSEEVEFKRHYLERFLIALDDLRQAGVPVCSYISYPGSQDVVNSLRLMLCDVQSGGCTHCPQDTDQRRLCLFMNSVWDRQVYAGLLGPGERSDVFESQSAILNQYREHRIQFFYLNVGGEIARIEAPQWVTEDPDMLDLIHSAVYDQCQRSGQYPPYPPALIEAHEQAVISTPERATVQVLVEQALAEKGVFYVRSAKDRSKRGRGV